MVDGGRSLVCVRHVLRSGERLYEERITAWMANSMEEAIALAEREVAALCETLDCEDTGLYQAWLSLRPDEIGSVRLRQGLEVFSLIRESDLPVKAYLDRFFETGAELQGSDS